MSIRDLGPVGLGGGPLGNLYRAIDDDEARAVVDAAWEGGIRIFDVAPHYGVGLAERRLGRALAGRPRDEYLVSTKVGRLLVPSPETAGEPDGVFLTPATHRRVWDFSRDGVLRSLEASLDRLGLDRVDAVYVHDPDDHVEEALASAVPALVELREQGVIRYVGVGMNSVAPLVRFVAEAELDVILLANRYTLLDQSSAEELLPLALERGVEVVVGGVYSSGLLSRSRVAPDARFDYVPAPVELVARVERIARVCERHGVSLPEAAVAFPLRHPAVSAELLGMQTVAEVRENLARAAAVVPDALWEELGV